ncbi:natterin-3-like isoform X1 [Xiphophorus hellerii]|uniref:natterin-3-like isoform X1 n=1 Tax=Xiphophorus hellerii TaxID=8084 RepID=UPI0013B45615|nr:natterin-3-like isoform X1 [Xiphophorus hellerii]
MLFSSGSHFILFITDNNFDFCSFQLQLLLLLLLLVLSSASPLDPDRNRPPDETVSSVNPDPADDVAKIKAKLYYSTVRRVLSPAPFRQKSPVNSTLPEFGNTGKLRWEKWQGSPPNGAISIYNSYADRIDYICKVGCNSGFYNPSKGSYCHYPNKKEEHRSSSFQILVNEDNFQILEWKEGSYGSVPQNAIRTCSSEEMYVGKNKYGLGKVDQQDQCFYLPWEGSEHWYRYYEVLTHMKAEEDLISDVKYHIKTAQIFKDPPKTLQSSTTTNHALSPVTKTVTLTKTTTDVRRWDISSSITVGVKKSISAGIPGVVSGNIEINAETTHRFSGGNTWTEQISHSVSLQLIVPPNHSCKVKMVGYQYKMDVPFTAVLKRTYEDGETRSVTISGNYHGVQVGDIEAEVEKCKPLSNSKRFILQQHDVGYLESENLLK